MKQIQFLLCFVLVSLFLLFSNVTSVFASASLDQSNAGLYTNYGIINTGFGLLAQTFTPTISGQVTEVDLPLCTTGNPASNTVTVRIIDYDSVHNVPLHDETGIERAFFDMATVQDCSSGYTRVPIQFVTSCTPSPPTTTCSTFVPPFLFAGRTYAIELQAGVPTMPPQSFRWAATTFNVSVGNLYSTSAMGGVSWTSNNFSAAFNEYAISSPNYSLDQSNSGVYTNYGVINTVSLGYLSQPFTPSVSGQVAEVDLPLCITGDPTTLSNSGLNVRITDFDSINNVPTGNVLQQVQFDRRAISNCSLGYTTVPLHFGVAPTLTAGKKYSVEVQAGIDNNTHSVQWAATNLNSSVGNLYSSPDETNWTSNNFSGAFREYVYSMNTPPSVNPIPNVSLAEGSQYSFTGSFVDPDSVSWTATVDYGDGSGVQPLVLSGMNFTLSHTYKDNGIYTVTVSITDNQGATGTGKGTVTVNNVPPTVSAITAPNSPIILGNSVAVSATFTDPGVLDTHTASWDWGDASKSAGTVIESNGSGSVSGSHTYAQTGVFTVTLTVTDKDGGQGSSIFQYISIYDPTASGLFSAARLFTSPTGALVQNPQTTGIVKFGITAKYSGTQPTGKVNLNFTAGNLDFASTSISALVIAGTKATVRGTGTINGAGNYTFLTTGIDGHSTGGQDFIRFQIKDSLGAIVYDTQIGAPDTADPTTPITGQVVVH